LLLLGAGLMRATIWTRWFIPYAFPLCWICFSYLISYESFSWSYVPVPALERALHDLCCKLSG